MRYNLTLKHIQISEKLNNEGRFIQTPEPSEADDSNCMYDMCHWLLWASINNKISNKKYIAMAQYFDTQPLVGEYYRYICKNF